MVQRSRAERRVLDVATPNDQTAEMMGTLANVAGGFQEMATTLQEKKDLAVMNDALAEANIKMITATDEWRKQNELDPSNPKAVADLDKQYRDIFGEYDSRVSIAGRGKWSEASRKVINQYKAKNAEWGITQTEANVGLDITNSMKKNFTVGYELGKKGDLRSAYTTFENSKSALESFGIQAMGNTKTQKLLKDYESDFMKMFVSGMADEDPDGALTMLMDKRVKESLNDPEAEVKLKSYAESKKKVRIAQLDRRDKIMGNNLEMDLTLKAINPDYDLTFVELQQAMEKTGHDGKTLMTPASARVISKLRGAGLNMDTKTDPKRYREISVLANSFSENDSEADSFAKMVKFRNAVAESIADGKLDPERGKKMLEKTNEVYQAQIQGLNLVGYKPQNAISRWFEKMTNKPIGLSEKERDTLLMNLNDELMRQIDYGKDYTSEEISSMARNIWNKQITEKHPEVLGAGGVPNKVATKGGGVITVSDMADPNIKPDIKYTPKQEFFNVKIRMPNGQITYRRIDADMKKKIAQKEGYEIVG